MRSPRRHGQERPRIPTAAGDVWPVAVLLAVTVLGVALTPTGVSRVRLLADVCFVLAGPGWAVVGLLPLPGRALRWTAAIALSITVCVLVAMVMLVAGYWHAAAAMVVLQIAVAAALAAQLLRRGRGRRHGRGAR